jgi:iron-sulfur cluster insertion protein
VFILDVEVSMPETDVDATESTTIVILTEAAQTAGRKFLGEDANPEGKVLRLAVNSGGCAGFSYAVSVDDQKDDDLVQVYDGFKAVVDPVSKQFLQDSTLDYVDTIGEAGFKFENPQAKSSCGCGTSFDV